MKDARRRLPRFLAPALLAVAATANAHAQARVRQAGDTILFEGRIDARSAAAFLRSLQDPQVRRLVIDSSGGLVGPALDMAEAIHARQLDIEVPASCHSSCANYLFPAARAKLLGKPDAVTWHGNMAHILYLERTGQGQWSAQEMDEARQLAEREADFFARIGVDGFVCWFAKIPPYSVDDEYTLSVEDMERFGIRDVSAREASGAAAGTAVPVRVESDALAAARAEAGRER